MEKTPATTQHAAVETDSGQQRRPHLGSNPLGPLIASLTERTKTSKMMAQRNRQFLADPFAMMGFHPLKKEMFYHIVLTRSSGSKVWDIDGNEYIDFSMGFGVNLMGHNPPFIMEALTEQLEKGLHLGQQSELAGEVAELIAELTGKQRVAFYNSGTEAVMTALRIARATSGRRKVALFSGSYHGHFDGTLVSPQAMGEGWDALPRDHGVIPNFVENVLVLEYGNPRSLELIEDYKNKLAAVLVEPVQSSHLALQPGEFLGQLRELTRQSGIALIFDEMITGFRVDLKGAQGWFGVEADIATYGKIVGGGMPIGVVAGKAEYMDALDGGMWQYGDDSIPRAKTTISAGTFCRHPLAMAAARAVLRYLKSQGPQLQYNLNKRAAELVGKLNDLFRENEAPIQLAHFGSLFGPASFDRVDRNMAEINPISYYLLNRGVLVQDRGYLSTAHNDDDIDCFVGCVKDGVETMRATGLLRSQSS
jgi:glutamate-1-semialdehyde aminotransferase